MIMTKHYIINAIEKMIGATSYTLWTIGVTDDPDAKKKHFESVNTATRFWQHWQADTLSDAKDILEHFTAQGMTNAPLDEGNALWVYVY
jgi:hypothetical protein